MPIITVKIAKGRSEEQKQEFAKVVTEQATEILQVKAEWVTILFEEYERENWASNGQLHSVQFGEGFGKKGAE